jgi:predicted RNase H-like nuclease (RuvC/YqgF family)
MNVINFTGHKFQSEGLPAHKASVSDKDINMQRLSKATMELHKSSLRQRTRVHEFHRATQELEKQIRKLEATCLRYQRRVQQIRVTPLRRAAINLYARMDAYLETNGTPESVSPAHAASR